MPEIAAPGLRTANGARLAIPCQQYARHTSSGTLYADEAALLAGLPALLEGVLANHQQQAQGHPSTQLLELEVGTDNGDTYYLTLESDGGGTSWQVAVDGRWVDGTPWASVQAGALAAVAHVLDIWDAA